MKTFSNTCLILLHLLSIVRFSTSSNTMQMQILRDGDTIVSASQTFELGFFSPGSSQNRYVGIWLKNIPARTVVWVANRESPLRNAKSGAFKVNRSGNLVIADESNNATVWSTNASSAAANPVFQLLDTGNLIIREEANTHDSYLWQSFDYPTDTLLPGMYYGWNLVTGKQIYLSSWKTNDDPAQGDISMGLDITGYPQVVVKRGGELKNRLGPFNGMRFSGSLNVEDTDNKAAALVINYSVVYYTWFYNQSEPPMRYTISPNGVGQFIMWVDQNKDWVDFYRFPADICDGYKACGAHGSCNNVKFPICRCLHGFVPRKQESWATSDWSGGCVRRAPLNCGDDVFFKFSGIKMPDARFTRHNTSSSLEECRTMCLGNCSCTAYSNLDVRNGGSGCLMWFGDLVDIREITGEDQEIYIRMAASELGHEWMKRTTLIAILTSFVGLLLVGLSTSLFFGKAKKYRKMRKEDMLEENNNDDMELRVYDLWTVTKATNNFSSQNKLGEGGFGPVYKGILEEGKEIAVKRLSETSSQGLEEFKNEVVCIAKLQHRNLVKLLGWCTEGDEKMLIYEYMPNKSLDVLLFNEAETTHIEWPKRLYIINGIARGLLYLHQDSCLRVIHRDLKASNVLLDSDLNPKISDFGMARIFRGNETEGNTRRVVGTYGYMSPEYAVEGFFSLKSDVYSFGVLVLEIVSAQTNRGFHHDDHHHNLVGHAWMLYKQGRSLELVDPNIANSINSDEVLRSIQVALLCVQECPEDRPSMSSVAVMFGSGGVLPEAKEPGFFIQRRGFVPRNSNEYTITQIEGR